MILFENIILINKYILMYNTINGRRKRISINKKKILENIIYKTNKSILYSEKEKTFLDKLYKEKQLLSEKQISLVENHYKNTIKKVDKMYLTIVLTYHCNMDCFYCFEEKEKGKYGYMSISDINQIKKYVDLLFDKYQLKKIDGITITGGEPLLEQNINTINHIANVWPNTPLSIFTNGANIIRFMDNLPLNNIEKFQVSLDSIKEIHCKRRMGNISYEKSSIIFENIIEGVQRLAVKNKHISLASTLDSETVSLIPEYMEMLKERKLYPNDNIYPGFSVVNDYHSKNFFHESDKEVFFDNYFKMVSEYPQYSLGYSILPNMNHLYRLIHRDVNEPIERYYSKCATLRGGGFSFLPNGKVSVCYTMNCDQADIGSFLPKEDPDYEKINIFRSRNVFSIKKCQKCKLKFLCGSGCPAPTLLNNEGLLNPSCGVLEDDYIMSNLGKILL